MKPALLRLGSLLAVGASLAALALLWRFRPEGPELPSSLSSPVTTAMLQQFAVVATWLLSALIILLLLTNSLRVLLTRRSQQPSWALRPGALPAPRHRSARQARLAAASAQAGFPPPFPLILRPRPEPGGELEYAPAPAPASDRVSAVTAQAIEANEPVTAQTRGVLRHDLPAPSIALLGPLEIAPSKRRRRGLRSRAQQLLAYLALNEEGATADELAAALWPNVDGDKARERLHRAASEARDQLGEVILRANECYFLDRRAVTVDLDRFEELLSRADAAEGSDREQLLDRASALVRGQPLAGSDYPWAAGEIRRLCATIVDLLEQLGYLRLDHGNPTGALAAAEQAIELDAYNEAAHQLAMHAEAILGLRQAIVERYEQLCGALDERFGLEPDRKTRLLYRRLLGQDASFQ